MCERERGESRWKERVDRVAKRWSESCKKRVREGNLLYCRREERVDHIEKR
jgi:hypothetical protein